MAKKIKPWDLDPEVIKEKVTDFRISREITKRAFANAVGIARITLRRIESGLPVEELTISKIANTFPKVFA